MCKLCGKSSLRRFFTCFSLYLLCDQHGFKKKKRQTNEVLAFTWIKLIGVHVLIILFLTTIQVNRRQLFEINSLFE